MRNCNKWEKGKGGLPTPHDSRSIRASVLKVKRVALRMCDFKSPYFVGLEIRLSLIRSYVAFQLIRFYMNDIQRVLNGKNTENNANSGGRSSC
jgi:hypothetical protein